MKPHAQSLQLVGDGDEEDILQDIEQTFGIHIWDEEARQLNKVGDLYQLILKKLGSNIKPNTVPFEQICLERLQQPLGEVAGHDITQDTQFEDFLPHGKYKKHIKEIEDKSGLKLPRTEIKVTSSQAPLYILLFVSPLLAWLFFEQHGWKSLLFLSGWLLIIPLTYLEKYELLYPDLRSLAKAVAGKNYPQLREETGAVSEDDVWLALTYALHRDNGVLIPIEQISAETTFFE